MGSNAEKPSEAGSADFVLLVLFRFWVVFSDSLAFSASIALFFVPKDPNGSGNGPKQNFKKT